MTKQFFKEELRCLYQTTDVNLGEIFQLKLQNPNSEGLDEEISPEKKKKKSELNKLPESPSLDSSSFSQ